MTTNTSKTNAIALPKGEEIITYQGKIIEVVEQTMQIGEKEKVFEKARRSPGCRGIILSSKGNILLTKEYRTEIKDWDYRLPGGKVYNSLEEYSDAISQNIDLKKKAEEMITLEIDEEVGIKVSNATYFATSICGATIQWDLYFFIIHVDSEQLGVQHLEQGENIQPGWYTPEEVVHKALEEMSEERSATILLRYLYKNNLLHI